MRPLAKVLVVDDEEQNRLVLKAMLKHDNHEVVLAAGGMEAMASAQSEAPDVILLDISMPEMDGFEVLKRLKKNEKTRFIPVVMVTALSDVDHRVKALELGADDFLAKPVERTELIARVRSLVKVKAYHDHMRNYQKKLESDVQRKTREIREATDKIKEASLETIYRLARAAEFKDEHTGAHLQRMSHTAAAIARKMGISETMVEKILYATPMHDVGKIGIPDHILLKPGALDQQEWKIMKQHTVFGAQILSGSSSGLIRLAEVIALSHHERWDGTGYPHGLKGNKIPVPARITAIIDVFDALTSKRPYKEPFSLDKSFTIIKEERGKHFDPEIVDAFFAIEDEIIRIKKEFKDEEESRLVQVAGLES